MALFNRIKAWFWRKFQTSTPPVAVIQPDPESIIGYYKKMWRSVLTLSRFGSSQQIVHDLLLLFKNGVDDRTVQIEYDDERQCLNSFLISKRIKALDVASDHLDRKRFSAWLESKVPSLKTWAMDNLAESMILPSKSVEAIDWARSKGFLGAGSFRESHYADAIVNGNEGEATIAMNNGGIDKLNTKQLERLLRALGTRGDNDANLMQEEGLNILWEQGGVEDWIGKLAALGDEALLVASEMLLLSISGTADSALVEKVRKIKDQKVKRFFSQALLRGAFAHGAEGLAKTILSKSHDYFGQDSASALSQRHATVLLGAGSRRSATILVEGGITMSEAAHLNGKVAWIGTLVGSENTERMNMLAHKSQQAINQVSEASLDVSGLRSNRNPMIDRVARARALRTEAAPQKTMKL